MTLQTVVVVVTLVLTIALGATGAAAQQPPPQQPPAPAPMPGLPDPARISAPQIQRWFEAFMVLQAQEALQLSEAQYGRFVTRLKALQETRRRQQQAKNRTLGDIRRLLDPKTGSQDEARLAELVKALKDADDRSAAELKRAYDAVDETLDVRQQARFRVFEERMEQQKLELLTRARQNARAARAAREGKELH
ncbi:MAG TPA: hypothetical protein VFK57_24435 [Vicinamibacterales bacterium]|nr:hypothetical protein [Vicinamibacterales bacterium]